MKAEKSRWDEMDAKTLEKEWEGLWDGYITMDERRRAIKQANDYRESIGIRKLSRKEIAYLFPYPSEDN